MQVMFVDYQEFRKVQKEVLSIFEVWTKSLSDFKTTARQTLTKMRDKADKQSLVQIEKNLLKERFEDIFNFRNQHEKLKEVIQITFSRDEASDSKKV